MILLVSQMHSQGVAVLGRVLTGSATVLVDVRVRLLVAVEHRLVDA